MKQQAYEEKEQERIKYENTCIDLKLGDYAQYIKYPGSVGQVCQYLKAYGLIYYDRVQIGFRNGIGTVELFGDVICTFRMHESIPVFTFSNGYDLVTEKQRIYLKWYNSTKP